MKQIEKFLIVIMVLTVISIAGMFSSNILLAKFYGAAEYGQMALFNKLVGSVSLFFKILVNICIAIWLTINARKYKAQPGAWFVFGIFFGIMAAVLFYLIRIHDLLKSAPEVNANSTI